MFINLYTLNCDSIQILTRPQNNILLCYLTSIHIHSRFAEHLRILLFYVFAYGALVLCTVMLPLGTGYVNPIIIRRSCKSNYADTYLHIGTDITLIRERCFALKQQL